MAAPLSYVDPNIGAIMKYTIKNPLNSPYSVEGEDGPVLIPARDEVTASFTDMQIHAIRATGYYIVTEAGGAKKSEPEPETEDDVQDKPRRGRPPKDSK